MVVVAVAPPPPSMPSLRSLLLERLNRRLDGSARCNELACGTEFACKSDSAAWKAHFAAEHPSLLQEMQARADTTPKRSAAAAAALPVDAESVHSATHSSTSSSVSESASKKQRNIVSMMSTFDPQRATSSLVAFLAQHSLGHNIVESSSFRRFLRDVGWTAPMPSRTAMRLNTSAQASSLRVRLIARLQQGPITIATDGWTNVRHEKVTNVILIVNGMAFYWCSIINVTEKNTAEWLCERMKPIISKLIDEHRCRIVGLVMDNEAVNRAMGRMLRVDFSFLVLVPCAAHTLQLVVHTCLESPHLAATVRQLRDLIRYFHVKENRQRLRRLQDANLHPALSVLQPNDTRWSSTLMAAERMIRLKPDAEGCFDCMSVPSIASKEAFFGALEKLITFLKDFQVATDRIQSDTATLFTVHEEFVGLLQHAKQQSAPWAAVNLLQRWKKYVNIPATAACCLLSFAPLPTYLQANEQGAQDFIIQFGSEYVAKYSLSQLHTTRESIADALTVQLAEFTGRCQRFGGLDARIAAIRRGAHVWNPRMVWMLYSSMELASVASALLSICASEAAVERSFSTQGAVHSKTRNRLGADGVDAEMMLRFNASALENIAAASAAAESCGASCREMDEDWSPDDDDLVYSEEELQLAEIDVSTDEEGEHAAAPAAAMEMCDEVPPDEEAAAAAAASANSRRVRRAKSVVFDCVNDFVAWFVLEYAVTAASTWNSDLRNALQHAATSRCARGPSTKSLEELIRARVARSA
jgi:hypothetical protein